MKINRLQVGDFLFFHSEKSFPDSVVSNGIQELTNSPWNHVATVYSVINGVVAIAEAISEGYVIRRIEDSIDKYDVRVSVRRWHGDGIGGRQMDEADKLKVQEQINLIVGSPYGYSQIAFLAVLCEINNKSLAGWLARQAAEEMQQMFEKRKTQIICSEGAYRVVARAGMPIRILNDEARKTYYNTTSTILELYRMTRQEDQLNPIIEDWITPAELAESPDIITMDDLEVVL